jgi:hypothetical protein
VPVGLVDEEAGDPPIRRTLGELAIRASELDPWQLFGGAELAPADAPVVIEDERRVRLSVADALFLLCPMVRPAQSSFRMERDAPAAAPDAVVALHETREVGPTSLRAGA